MKNKFIFALFLLAPSALASEPEYDIMKLLSQYDALKASQEQALVAQENDEKKILLDKIAILEKEKSELQQKLDECLNK